MTEIDPKWVRVSSVLSIIPTRDGLKWTYPMQQIDPVVLERKRILGSSVHAAISEHVKKEFYVVDDKERGFFESYLLWEKEVSLTCHQTERRFYFEPMGLTGCIDMLAKINPNGLFHLIDFKCTISPDHVKWPIQAALYELLARSNGMELDKRALFVQLDPNGGLPRVHEYEITKELTSAAVSIYNMYMYLTKKSS